MNQTYNDLEAANRKAAPPADVRELKEQLAAIEHERWSDWQQYMHDKMGKLNGLEDTFVLDGKHYKHWQRQIMTPYKELTEAEKNSDREQVDRYWPLIESYIQTHTAAAERQVVKLRADIAYAIGYCQGFNHPCAYLENQYPELINPDTATPPAEAENDRG